MQTMTVNQFVNVEDAHKLLPLRLGYQISMDKDAWLNMGVIIMEDTTTLINKVTPN